MAESFEDRVKRLFGSKAFESVTATSFPSSSWSVANGDVERREWNRDRNLGRELDEDEGPFASSFYGKDGCLLKKKCRRDKVREFEGDLDDLDDDEDERENGVGDEEREEREIRNSIGLDSTLDNEILVVDGGSIPVWQHSHWNFKEFYNPKLNSKLVIFQEEEDEYDKAALCREIATERVYMRDVKDHGPYINYHVVVPDFLDEPDESCYFRKDPRADHLAASVRLKQDEDIVGSGGTSTASSAKITENDINPKPILKRKESQIDQKPKKRVRFDPGHIDDHNEESPGVPDYLRNPSKYTPYTFDLSEGNDPVKKSEPDITVELPKSVTFMPRKKSINAVPMDDSPMSSKELAQVSGCSIANETDACEIMDEDDREMPVVYVNAKVQKARQYRPKSTPDDSS